MKTIIEWLGEIEDSAVRTKALKNLDPKKRYVVVEHISEAILSSFIWEYTPEGQDYWEKIYYDLMRE